MHAWFCRIIDTLPTGRPICQIETEFLGFDHAALGEFVTVKWGLPQGLSASIGSHHRAAPCDGPHRELIHVAALANFLCHYQGVSSLGIPVQQPVPIQALHALGLTKDQLTQIVAQIPAALETAETLAAIQLR